jgi:branched-chain amino acid transport system permease protein
MYSLEIILQQIFNGVVLGSTYVLIASGFSLIWGVVGILNLAHGEFFMLGAFSAYYISTYLKLNPMVSILITMLIIFGVGAFFEKSTLKPLRHRKGMDYEMSTLMMTIGIQISLQNLALIIFGPKYKGIPSYFDGILRMGPLVISYDRMFIFVVAILLIAILLYIFKYTRIGLAMRAVSQNSDAASLAGIPKDRTFAIAFALSTSLAGAAGALLIPIYNAYPMLGGNVILLAFSIVIFGGLGSVKGAIYAGFIVGIFESLAVLFISSAWKDVIVFLVVILVLTFRPRGLFGLKEA